MDINSFGQHIECLVVEPEGFAPFTIAFRPNKDTNYSAVRLQEATRVVCKLDTNAPTEFPSF